MTTRTPLRAVGAQTPLAIAVAFAALMALYPLAASAQPAPRLPAIELDKLNKGDVVLGFRVEAVYLNDANQPMGARFVHAATGFVFDALGIQSVPQAFIWVNSYPTSDMGEPHTQEHLLLGKGNNGRYTANLEGMSLSISTAYTQQWRTCYQFNTGAGPEVYYQQFERRMHALLNPDYTDEEIRREVCNFGVAVNPKDGALRLEEKGTVYNEMVSSFERPWSRLGRAVDLAIYGGNHPLAYVSGGLPSAIRVMAPQDIRLFHREHYRLDNMGMVGAFPKEIPLADLLERTNRILMALKPAQQPPLAVTTEATLPKPVTAAPGTIIHAEYPNRNPEQPAPLVFAWPPQLDAPVAEQLWMEAFVNNIAGDETSNLYRLFIDTKTRRYDAGAQGVFGWTSTDQGMPISIGLDDVAQANLTDAKIAEIRGAIIDELKRIASWPDGSPELMEFNARARNQVVANRRGLAKFVNSPPRFGYRGTPSSWMNHLDRLNKTGEFRASVTMKGWLGDMERELANGKNYWRDYIMRWKLLDQLPIAVAAKPSPALIEQETKERTDRIAAETARLRAQYGAATDQEAIERYRRQYDSMTAELDRIAATARRARFVDTPPLTLDDQLEFSQRTLAGGVPMVASTFENMTSATTGLALRLDGVAVDDYVYLSLLPNLLTSVGLFENGTATPYDRMTQQVREEILGLSASFASNWRTGRAELVVRGAGNDRAEAQRSIEWMRRVLTSADFRPENLARIRDVVDQNASSLRTMMQGSEESWVNNPAAAYRWQDNRLMLATESFLTRAHNAHRLRWLLKDAGTGESRTAIAGFLERLAGVGGLSRPHLTTLTSAIMGDTAALAKLPTGTTEIMEAAAKLPPAAHTIAVEAAGDLQQLMAEIPDETMESDWAYLCRQIRHDLLTPPAQTLAALDRLRKHLLLTGGARLFMIGSHATQEYLAPAVGKLIGALKNGKLHSVPPGSERMITNRLRERAPNASPLYVGLVNPNTSSGVFINSAAGTSYRDTDRESLLRFLAAKLFGGHGSHGIFMKTWAAGLAYSNGLGSSPASGRVSYYAERCPELPQTLKFVIDELKRAAPDTGLVDYAVAQAFDEFRSPSSYEARGEAIAADIADDVTPGVVSAFRRAILALRSEPNLAAELFKRMPQVYGSVLPGYSVKSADVRGGCFFVIGPEKQMGLYEEYLKTVDGPEARLYRLYPRDFWMPATDLSFGTN